MYKKLVLTLYLLILFNFGNLVELTNTWYHRPRRDLNMDSNILNNHYDPNNTASGDTGINKGNQCYLNSCKRATSQMLVMMDHDPSPCENFHKMACGGNDGNNKENLLLKKQFSLLENHLIHSFHHDSLTGYLKTFTNFYKSCLHYDMEFNYVDRMTFVHQYAEKNLTKIFSDMILTQSMPFFDIGLDIGRDSLYKFQITLQGESYLKTSIRMLSSKENIKIKCLEIMNNTTNLDDLHSIFQSCVKESTQTRLGDYLQDSGFFLNRKNEIDSDTLQKFFKEIQEIWPNDFQIQLAKRNKMFQTMTIAELDAIYNMIDWKTFFISLSNKTFDANEKIQVYFPDYIENLFGIFKKYEAISDTETKESKLVRILRSLYSYNLYENTIIPPAMETREVYCVYLCSQLMPDLTTDIMYQIHRQNDLHPKNHEIKKLFELLKKRLSQSFQDSELHSDIYIIFQNRLAQISLGLLSAGNSKSLLRTYDHLKIKDNEYQKDFLKLLVQFRRTIYSLVNANVSPATLLNYFVSPFETVPKTFYGSNYIVFHPAIYLRSSENLPNYLRLSKQGFHLSRELVKHFDLFGKYYLSEPDNTKIKKFYDSIESQTNQLLDKFYLINPYELNEVALTFQVISAPLLVNEIIIDNGAFRLITDSLEEVMDLPWISSLFSPLQIFVINVAQEYCDHSTKESFMFNLYEKHILPAEIKIQNIVSNFLDFKVIFSCNEGSAMVLDESVIVQFPYLLIEEDYEEENSILLKRK